MASELLDYLSKSKERREELVARGREILRELHAQQKPMRSPKPLLPALSVKDFENLPLGRVLKSTICKIKTKKAQERLLFSPYIEKLLSRKPPAVMISRRPVRSFSTKKLNENRLSC